MSRTETLRNTPLSPSAAKRFWADLVLIPTSLVLLFPVVYALLLSTQSLNEYLAGSPVPGSSFTANLQQILGAGIPRALLNTTVIAAVVAVLKVGIGFLGAAALSFFDFPGKKLVLGLILLTLLLPGEVYIVALYRLVGVQMGLGDTFWALILPSAATAGGVLLLRQHFSRLPRSLPQAAQLDGSGPWNFLARIVLPMSWNIIAALFVIAFLGEWNSYFWPSIIIRSPENQLVQVALTALQSNLAEANGNPGPLMLAAFISTLPPLAVFIALRKQYLSGLNLNAGR